MHNQSLYKILKDHIKPKIIKKNNRYKKWDYGYNIEHDVIVISRTGEIGDVYEIQNLKIALPKKKILLNLNQINLNINLYLKN